MREELMKSEFVQKRYNQIMSSKGTAEADKWLGMLVRTMSKPYTLKLVLGGMKGEQSAKDMVCACNDNHGNCNASTNNNDSASDT